MGSKYALPDLVARLEKAEAIVNVLRQHEADAIIYRDGLGFLRPKDVFEREQQAERALRRNEQQLCLALESAHATCFDWSLDSNVVSCDAGNEPPPDSIAAPPGTFESVLEQVHPEDREQFTANFRAALERPDGRYENEFRIIQPDGQILWRTQRGLVERDASGHATQLIGLTQDISERKRTEQAITGIIGFAVDITERRRAEQDVERFKALMDHNPSLAFLKDDAGKYVYLNRAYQTHFVGSKDWHGKTDFDFWPKESAELFRANDAEVLKSGKTKQYLEDSTSFDGTRYCWLCYKFVFVDSQDRKYLGGIGVDVTDRVQAEEELVRAKTQLAVLLDTAPVGFCHLDRDLRYLMINDRLAAINGVSVADTLGKTVAEVVPTLLPAVQEVTSRILATGEAVVGHEFSGETPLQPGVTRNWSESWYPVRDDATGAITGFGVIVEEITKRKKAEAALAEQRDLLDVVFQHMPAAVNLIRGRDLRLLMANPAYRALAPGKTELVGKTLDQIWPETGRDFSALCRRVLDTGEPHHAVDDRVTIQRQPGGPLEEAYFNWSLYRVRLPGDDGWGIFNPAWETTERKQAEAAAQQGLQTLAKLIERSPFGIYIVDAQFRIAMMNSSSQEGAFRNVQPVVGRPFDEAMRMLWPEDVAAEIIGHFRHALDTGEPYFSRDFINPRHDAEIVEAYEWELHRMTLPDGQHGVICYYYDSTKLRQAEAALRESEARLRRIAQAGQIGFVEWNAATDKSYWSTEHYELLGFEPGSTVTWERWRDGLHPADRDRVLANAARLLERGRQEGQVRGHKDEYRFIRPDGVVAWLEADMSLDMTDGEPIIRGSLRDITERKHADERLRESEERFRLMADNIAQMAWMADGSGSLFWYNQRWFDYTGTTLEEMQGWGWQKVQHPDHLDRVARKYRHCLETGEPWEDTFPLKGADGNYRWFLSRAIPQRNAFTGQVLRWFGTNTDITEQRAIEEELRKFKVFSHQAGDMHLLLDRTGQIRYANKRACTQLGYSESELLSLNIAAINPPRAGRSFHEVFVRSKESVIPPFEGIHRGRSGATIPVEITATMMELNDGWQMFMTSRDITERKRAEEKVRAASMHDLLTGLPNRALVFEYCNHMLAAAQRRHSEGALLFIDLDRFKPVNDLYGHEIGDRVLQEVARRLVGCTRDEDIVGRLGGDEFVIALPHVTDDHQRAEIVAQHVIEHLSEPYLIDTLEISLSPSIGISYFPKHASEVGALIHAADMAMYQAKQSGRANYHVYTAELDRRANQAHSLERQLKHALKNESLQLYYQPVIDLDSGQVISAEALLRLPERNGRRVGPDRFIPIAESAGLIGDLGEWVAVEACRQHEAWQREGMRITIAINVSPLQFRQSGFAANLGSIITNSPIDPACLEIEVTESTVMESVDEAVAILNKIKSLGVKVSLDDFGTGYSSLSRLSTLPIDKLKVDQSFVKRIEHDPASRAVTGMIIALGHSMRLDVVGEGIESEEALNYLQSVGCHQGQGYWFGPPLAADDFAQWYRVRRAEVDTRLH